MPRRTYTANDFSLITMRDGTQRFLIRSSTNNNVQVNLSLVAFKTHKCEFCRALDREYDLLSQKVDGVSFDSVFLDENNMMLIKMGAQTPFQLTSVPLIILFVNGVSYMRFPQGIPRDFSNITKFLTMNVNNSKKELAEFVGEIKHAISNIGATTGSKTSSELQRVINSLSGESTGVPICYTGDTQCNGLYTVVCDDYECHISMADMERMNPTFKK